MNIIHSKPGLNYNDNRTKESDALASQPWITPDDLTGDIARLICIVVTPYIDGSNPMLNSDELHAECRAKLAMILHAGHLNKCPTRAKAFGFIKTAMQNHLRSLVQKHAFTAKRAGIKPPPKRRMSSGVWVDPQPSKAFCVSLNDEQNHIDVGRPDSAFDKLEFLEELNHVLTPEERAILEQLMQTGTDGAGMRDPVSPDKKLSRLVASIRSKARTILHGTPGHDHTVAPAHGSQVESMPKPCAAQVMNVPAAANTQPRTLVQPLRHPNGKTRMTKSGGRKNKKIHVISFRLTRPEVELLRRRDDAFKSLNHAARRIVTKVLRSEAEGSRWGRYVLAKGTVPGHHAGMSHSEITLTREELYAAIWTTPACHLCKSWGITSNHLLKICEQFGIPRPSPDYWPLLRLGRSVERSPMPPATAEMPSAIHIRPRVGKRVAKPRPPQPTGTVEQKTTQATPIIPAVPTQAIPVQVARDFRKVHPLIRISREALEKGTPDRYGRVGPGRRAPCVNIVITKQQLQRALFIMDAVFRVLESQGHKAEVIESRERYETGVRVGDEMVRVKITERTIQREREISAEEKARPFIWNRYVYEPTGILTFSIEEYCAASPKTWTDTKHHKIEDSLGEIVNSIAATGELLRLRRIEAQAEQRRRAEQEKRAFKLRQRREEERARRQLLQQEAELWDKADRLRSFIGSCEARLANGNLLGPDSAAKRWLEWARRCADELDPLNGDYLLSAIRSLPEESVQIVPPV